MKLTAWKKIALVMASAFVLASCSSAKKDELNRSAIDEANSAYQGDRERAQTSGLGEDSRFSGQDGYGRNLSQKRIYHFDYDSNVVRDEDRPAIVANAGRLVTHPGSKTIVEGHTDPRGSREYNIGLGERRAHAVAKILTNNGVNRGQLRVVSYGAQKPAASGHSEAAYQQDRRAALVYVK